MDQRAARAAGRQRPRERDPGARRRRQPLGFVVLVHDLSFVERREAKTRAVPAGRRSAFSHSRPSLVTVVAARLSWRGWSDGAPQAAARRAHRPPEFQPILRDVRELVDRIVAREGGGRRGRPVDAAAAQADAEPLPARREGRHRRQPRALHPRARARTAAISVRPSGERPRDRARAGDARLLGRLDRARQRLRRPRDRRRQRRGCACRRARSPICSGGSGSPRGGGRATTTASPTRGSGRCATSRTPAPSSAARTGRHYQAVNQKFADAAVRGGGLATIRSSSCRTITSRSLPRLIRERLPRATVIMFWHIPWPNSERFGICPWREGAARGNARARASSASTPSPTATTSWTRVDRFLEARIDREQNAVVQHGHSTLVRPYPISLEWPNHWSRRPLRPPSAARASAASSGWRPTRCSASGVDRLDYTKGVEERLLAVERLLERCPSLIGRFTFVQLAAPSRTVIERYRELNERVERLAARINERFGDGAYRPDRRCCARITSRRPCSATTALPTSAT